MAADANSTNAPKPSAPKTVKLTVDGRAIEAPEGTPLLQAMLDAGIDIPHYCYHPKLSIDGSCRLCQVKIEGMPKLQISCNTQVRDGMVVHTAGPGGRAGTRAACSSCSCSTIRWTARSATRPASAGCRTTRCASAAAMRARSSRGASIEQAPRHRRAHAARPGTLHPVPALRALLPRNQQDRRARRFQPRRPLGARRL